MSGIGVALCGCDAGGVSAYHVLTLLEESGWDIEMISASGIASLGALAFAVGLDRPAFEQLATEFLDQWAAEDLDTALETFAHGINLKKRSFVRPVALCATTLQGESVSFTGAYRHQAENLITWELTDSYDALSATVGLMDGLGCYPYRGQKLCDYAGRHGCPHFPLRLMGMNRVLSVSFLPEEPRHLWDLLLTRMIGKTIDGADNAVELTFESYNQRLADYEQIATQGIQAFIDRK